MPVFEYRARTSDGRLTRGEVTADSRELALKSLHDDGLMVSGLQPQVSRAERSPAPSGLVTGLRRTFLKIKPMDRAGFWRQLAQSQRAGLGLSKSLSLVGDAGYGPLSAFCRTNADAVSRGERLSDRMRTAPDLFGALEVGLIHAGEAGGSIDDQMQRLALHFEREMEMRNFLRWRLLYLKLLAGAFLLSGFSVTVIAPWLMARGMGQPTSLIGRVLGFVLPIVIAVAAWYVLRVWHGGSRLGQEGVDRLKVSVPVLGPLFRKLSIARFSQSLGQMVAAGLPLSEGVEIASETTGNIHLTRRLAPLPERLRQGEPLHQVLASTGFFPRQVVQMIHTGEESGNIDEMLGKVAEYYDSEVQAATTALAVAGFVAVILVAAVAVGFFVARSYVGMYSSLIDGI